ncbi:MAG: BatD family protein [Verrucomicrobiota bacterium]
MAIGAGPGPRGARLALALFAGLLLGAGLAGAASFTATLDRDTVPLGEGVTLTLRFDGGRPDSVPQLPMIPNVEISAGNFLQSVNVINDQSSISVSQSYLLRPNQVGEYTIPALKAVVEGRTLSSLPLKFKAVASDLRADQASGDQLAFLRLLVPKKELYLGEVTTVQLQLFVRDTVANAGRLFQGFASQGAGLIKTEGFNTLKTANGQPQQVQVGNSTYFVEAVAAELMPVKAGALSIEAIQARIVMQVLAPNQQRREFIDPLGVFNQYQEKSLMLSTPAETLQVLPLPPGAPAGFNGAVGSYKLEVSAGPTNLAVGDPITTRVRLSGSGALDSLQFPEQAGWKEFKSYPPTAKTETQDPLGVQGSRSFELVLVPQSTTIRDLPPVEFTYFDVEKKTYETLKSDPIPLTVGPSSGPMISVAAGGRAGAADNASGPELVPIRQRLGNEGSGGTVWIRQPAFLAVQAVPLVAFFGAVLWRRRSDEYARNPELRRRKHAAQAVSAGLAELRRCAAANRSGDFFAALFRVLQEQLGASLGMPAGAITEAVIEDKLRPGGFDPASIERLHRLFQACNQARYAPVQSAAELDALIPDAEETVRRLQKWKS